MLFKCRKTRAELSVLRTAMYEEIERLSNWHRCFAWLPVNIDESNCALFQFIERRYPKAHPKYFGIETYGYAIGKGFEVEYRLIAK